MFVSMSGAITPTLLLSKLSPVKFQIKDHLAKILQQDDAAGSMSSKQKSFEISQWNKLIEQTTY